MQISLVNISAQNANGTYRQYISINNYLYHLLLHDDGSCVANGSQLIAPVQNDTGLTFAPANLLGFDCMIARDYMYL